MTESNERKIIRIVKKAIKNRKDVKIMFGNKIISVIVGKYNKQDRWKKIEQNDVIYE